MAQDAAQKANCDVEKVDEVREYFNGWSLYQKAMCANYLHHMEVYKLLHELMESSLEAFSILDLGCGDAHFMAEALSSTGIERYTGVDISPVALDLARKNLQAINCQKSFLNRDLSSVVEEVAEEQDLIWTGLSMHHLTHSQKGRFISRCFQILKPGGRLLAYEPTLREGEDVDHHTQRWWEVCKSQWNDLTPEEKTAMYRHVASSDFPESVSVMKEMGLSSGFREVKSLFCDRCEIYQLISFQSPKRL
jgi:SAM-dependent methyltransferase